MDETFNLIDKDNSGFIDRYELKAGLAALGQPCSDDDVKALLEEEGLFEEAKAGDDLRIDRQGFQRIIRAGSKLTLMDVIQMYHAIDIDASGYITSAELQHFMGGLGLFISDDSMAGLMNIYDDDGNARITFEEFKEIVLDLGFSIDPFNDDDDLVKQDRLERSQVETMQSESKEATMDEEAEEEKYIDLSSITNEDLRAALLPFDVENSGCINLTRVREAAEAMTSSNHHFSPNRPVEGLATHIRGVNHIAVLVSDVSRSLRFYKSVMGFEQIRRPNFDATGAWLTMGNCELHLIKGTPLIHEGDDLVVGHISIDVNSSDMDAVFKKLQEMKVPFRKNSSVPAGADAGSMNTNANENMMSDKITSQFFLRDPDGYYIEICNCGDTLTQYCLGKKDNLPGYVEGIKPLSLKTAWTTITLLQRWIAKSEAHNEEIDLLSSRVKRETDGSIEQVAKLLDCRYAESVDQDILQTVSDRWSIYGDVWQNEEESDIEHVLKSAGGCPKKGAMIAQLRSSYRGTVIMRPPIVFNEDGTKTIPTPIVKIVGSQPLESQVTIPKNGPPQHDCHVGNALRVAG